MPPPPMAEFRETVRTRRRPPAPEPFADVADGDAADPARKARIRTGAEAAPCLTLRTPLAPDRRVQANEPRAEIAVRGETSVFDGLPGAGVVRPAIPCGPGRTDPRAAMDAAPAEPETARLRQEEPGRIPVASGSAGTPEGVGHSARVRRGGHEIAVGRGGLDGPSQDDLRRGAGDDDRGGDDERGGDAASAPTGPRPAGICAFEPGRRLRLIAEEGGTIFAAAASECRRRAGEGAASFDLSMTAGESLDGGAARRLTGTLFLESHGRAEPFTMVASFPRAEIRVALKHPFEGLAPGCRHDPARTEACLRLAADGATRSVAEGRARKGADVRLRDAGRADDVVAAADRRIGPAEVEAAAITHDAAPGGACAASPDAEPGGARMTEALRHRVKARTAPRKHPRRVKFPAEPPKTASGKIPRGPLRDREAAQA